MAGRRVLYGLALLGGLVFYGAYQEWFSWIVLLTLLLFPWLSLLLSLGTMLRTKLEPAAAGKIPVGSQESIQLTVHGKKLQPPLKSKIRVTKAMTGETWILNPGDRLPTDHCGGFYARLHKPRVYDFLGLFCFRARKAGDRTFLVWPEPRSMALPSDLTRYLARCWRPKPGGGYAENHEIRQYRPGDNLNQIHWKLSAKVGKLMLRESMEPARGVMLLTMDLQGTPEELDRKFGHLLWLGNWFLENSIPFEVRALTGNGVESWAVSDVWSLQKSVEALLCAPCAKGGSIRDRSFAAAWQHHIGGEPDEE